jgi:hypothetical protein
MDAFLRLLFRRLCIFLRLAWKVRERFSPKEPLLWLPPVMQEHLPFKAYDRVRTSVRPQIATRPEAAGRYGDLRIGSKSEQRVFHSERFTGFPESRSVRSFAHWGRRLLHFPYPTSGIFGGMLIMPPRPASNLDILRS